MRSAVVRGICILGIAVWPVSAADLVLVPQGATTIGAGGQVTVEVFVNNIAGPDLLRSYQAQLDIVAGPGTTGSLGLAGPVPLDSIFIDTSRTDWVFFAVQAGAFTGVNASKLRIAGTLDIGAVSPVAVADLKYCGTYVFEASADAAGDFQIQFASEDPANPGVPVTFLANQSNVLIPFTALPAGGLTVTVTDLVSNDDCANALSIGSGVTPFVTQNATTDGPALPATGCDDGAGLSFEQDAWFEHVAGCTGILTVSTCNDADFNTRLAVYGASGPACACPTDNTTLLACDDDAPGCGVTSEAVLSVTQGDCYTIRVGGLGPAQGAGNLTITCAPDLCVNAQPISVGSTTAGSTENTAVNDTIGPDCGSGPPDSPGVWYSVTGTGNLMSATLLPGASFDTRLTVYEGGCAALACVGDADTPGGSQESVSWCSTPGTEYLILVHGAGGASGAFSLNVTQQSCNDGSVCTDDSCSAGACVNVPNFDTAVSCCAPSTGNLTPIDDANPCTNDVCDPATGVVSHPPVPDGPDVACDDNFSCTLDECVGGVCTNTDINNLTCVTDLDCPGETTCGNDTPGFCSCASRPPLQLIADPGSLTVEGCYATSELITVRVEMGVAETPIVGVQFFLEYDASTLGFVSIDPGAALGGGSPFAIEVQEQVDPALGTIDYVVGANFGSPTLGPATVAAITFRALSECSAFVRFRPTGPLGQQNLISAIGGGQVEPDLFDLPPVAINGTAPMVTGCPSDMTVSADPGVFTAVVTWPAPSATDSCDPGPVPVSCTPPSGSVFNPGTTPVTCSATNACGVVDSCFFNVTVAPPSLSADVQLSSSVDPGPFERCITFDLWDCTGPPGAQHATVQATVVFNNGLGSVVNVPIPAGQWQCLTARDELHTLRSTAADFTTLDGTNYTASFLGSRGTGGHWLLGGNLNDDDFIDILDFGVFFPFFLTQADAGTPCGTAGPNANINGDQIVNLLDLVFVSGNSLQASEPACCAPARAAGALPGPVMSITTRELRARGLDELIAADINRDGVLDVNDILALVNGEGPPDGDGRSLRDLLGVERKGERKPRR